MLLLLLAASSAREEVFEIFEDVSERISAASPTAGLTLCELLPKVLAAEAASSCSAKAKRIPFKPALVLLVSRHPSGVIHAPLLLIPTCLVR
jgi:hypothetical protein